MAQLPNPFGDSSAGAQIPQNREAGNQSLLGWIMPKVQYARRVRDQKYAGRWAEYTRLVRGFYSPKDKNTDSERSRLIAPALQQAVEMTVAEMEEAVFHRSAWFDLDDDISDQDREDATQARDQLLEDFAMDGVPHAVSQAMLLGATYGTGIAKINVLEKEEVALVQGKRIARARAAVTLSAIRPDEFVIDPSALDVNEALFCAHEMIKPLHGIREKQNSGLYRKVELAPYTGLKSDTDGTGAKANVQPQDEGVLITEYYGKVPASLLGTGGRGMVESIVTIANETHVLRAIESPFIMKDRPIIAYQHDTVPGEFWGRGVCEKGYNPQKALDAELRARIDALALMTAPMVGVDVNRIGGTRDTSVRPGRTVFTRGRPSEIMEPIVFGDPAMLAHTFQHTGDLERMVQMGTGAMDSATPVGVNARNETASGISQLQAGFIKRSKRTMQNLERTFLDPLITKALWRYVQYAPDRYPKDYKFVVNATMGIMAKEVENNQLINMLAFVPPESKAHPVLVQAIFENSASANKRQLAEVIKAMAQPPSEEEQQLAKLQQQIAIETAKESLNELKLKNAKLNAEIGLLKAKTEHEVVKTSLEDDLVEIQAANAATAAEKARVARQQTVVAAQRNNIEARKAATKTSE